MPLPRKRRDDPRPAAPGPAAALTAELAETRTAITDFLTAARSLLTELLAAIGPLRDENRDLRAALSGHRAAMDRDRAEVRKLMDDLKAALGRLAAAEPAPPAPDGNPPETLTPPKARGTRAAKGSGTA